MRHSGVTPNTIPQSNMNKAISAVALIALTSVLSGCASVAVEMAGLVDRTPEEIRRSKYHLEVISERPSKDVTKCMVEAVNAYKSETGYPFFAGDVFVNTSRDYGSMQEIINRTQGSPAFGGGEIMFLIENLATPTGGTKSQIWGTPNIPFGAGSQGYLDKLVGAVKPCLGAANASATINPSNVPKLLPAVIGAPNSAEDNRAKDGPTEKLEQLKGLLDRGIISKEDFEKKKKEILDRF